MYYLKCFRIQLLRATFLTEIHRCFSIIILSLVLSWILISQHCLKELVMSLRISSKSSTPILKILILALYDLTKTYSLDNNKTHISFSNSLCVLLTGVYRGNICLSLATWTCTDDTSVAWQQFKILSIIRHTLISDMLTCTYIWHVVMTNYRQICNCIPDLYVKLS